MRHLIRMMRRHDLIERKKDDDKDREKDNDKDKYIKRTPSMSNPRDL